MQPPYEVTSEDGVWINGDYYCKTPNGLRAVLTGLRTFGYVATSQRYSADRTQMPIGAFEQCDMPMWHCKLPGVHMVQCVSCGGIIDPKWVANEETSGRPCEFCGESTMKEPDERYHGPDQFIPNYEEVLFWRGLVYPRLPAKGALPFPEQVSVYEAWRWAPLAPGNDLTLRVLQIGGINTRRDWYREGETLDGLRDRVRWMTAFVTNFTSVNLAAWTRAMDGLLKPHRALAVTAYDTVHELCI